MITFLLLLSLMLNAGAIFAIILLYLRQNRLVEAEKKQERIIGEIEEVFSAYLLELKEENDNFIQTMKKTKNLSKTQIDSGQTEPEPTGPELDTTNSPDKEQNYEPAPRPRRGVSYHAAKKAYMQNIEPAAVLVDGPESGLEDPLIKDDSTELQNLSFIDRVIYLKNQGLSVEEIARDLDKGKTEIELLLKFRQST